MKNYIITGFNKYGVWRMMKIRTIRTLAEQRAKENGFETVLDITEEN